MNSRLWQDDVPQAGLAFCKTDGIVTGWMPHLPGERPHDLGGASTESIPHDPADFGNPSGASLRIYRPRTAPGRGARLVFRGS